jgi:large subunit ribosomal protein L7/L12
MAKLSNDDLLDAFKEMTLLELSEFVKQFEETFNVSAAAPVAVAAGPAGAGAGAATEEAAEEQTEFDVVLTGAGEKKIQVIKEVRSLTSLGLRRPRTWSTPRPSRCSSASPGTRPRRPRPSWRAPAPPSS